MRSRPVTLALLAGLLCSGRVQHPAPLAQDPAVRIDDLTPQFLRFYDSATSQHADPARRWTLWRRLYGFAAVPPTPYGDSLARRLLDSAWDRYPAALSTIARGAAGLGIFPDTAFQWVAALLGCGDTVKVRLTIFVGGFEGNAFAYGYQNGRYGIAVPVEAGDPARSIIHELTHALHRGGCATFPAGSAQSVAELVVTEGLAMQVVRRALPGHTADYYTVAAPGWLADARARRRAILDGIRQHWTERDPAAVQRFTFGEGTTGLHREGYYAGWELVAVMLDRLGMSLHDVATTDPAQYPALLARALRVAE